MEIKNRVSVFQNSHNISDGIAERPKPANGNSEPIKNEQINFSDGVLVMMIMPNEESE